MKITLPANKQGNCKLLFKLKETEKKFPKNSKRTYLPFPEVFRKIGGSCGMKKEEIWEMLYLIRDLGLIQIIPYHGITLNYDIS